MAAAGFRGAHDGHRDRVIQSLEFTIGPGQKVIDTFDGFRKKRNISTYDITVAVSEREADEMRGLANMLRSRVEVWLWALHPPTLQDAMQIPNPAAVDGLVSGPLSPGTMTGYIQQPIPLIQ